MFGKDAIESIIGSNIGNVRLSSSEDIGSVASNPVKYDSASDSVVDRILDSYYANPDGTLPTVQAVKYLAKDTPQELRELIEQRVMRQLPNVRGTSEEVAAELPVGPSRTLSIGELQDRYADLLRSTFDSDADK